LSIKLKNIKKLKNTLKISIITVTKNSERFLQKTIDSLSKQTYQNFEHIVIDGASTDRTLDIIKKNSNKITKWISEPDQGLYHAMNKGLSFCNGEIVGILNSDDVYFSDALSIVNEYFIKNEIDFLFGSVFKHKLMHGFYPKKIHWTFGFYTAHSVGFFIKKLSQDKIGFYNTKYKWSADYDIFYKMIVKHKMKGMATKKNEVLGNFRPGGLSSSIRYIDFLKENNQIRLDNGQNKIVVFIIFFLRLLRNFKKLFK
jgi:glycosyltransferase involved in cell wall biosynthesis|tara:strand:+ start:4831 stop:5598 length:768 start_codon:yes stop_codon:yes gene_type:complete